MTKHQLQEWYTSNQLVDSWWVCYTDGSYSESPMSLELVDDGCWVVHTDSPRSDEYWIQLSVPTPPAVQGIPQVPQVAQAQSIIIQQTIAPSGPNVTLLYESQKKSGALAAFLNAILPGVGYMYCGMWIMGILVLLTGWFFIWITLGFMWLIFVIDGFLAARRYNKKLAKRLSAVGL